LTEDNKIVLALPKGRLLAEAVQLLARLGVEPEPAFRDSSTRQLRFATSDPFLDLIQVRSFDTATFIAFGAAQIGIVGNDVLMEFNYSEIYAPLDLRIGRCRLVVAEPEAMGMKDNPLRWSRVRVATKYPALTRRHFAARGVQAECIKLHGAMELAPSLGLCERIVDLVATGETLRHNGLVEVEKITDITSRLTVNRTALKTRTREVTAWIERFQEMIDAKVS